MNEIVKSLRKYNPWDGDRPKTGFIRQMYLDKIEHLLGNDLIKVFVGQRRSGKSYLLRQVMDLLLQQGVPAQNLCYLNKEMIELDEINDYQKLHSLILAYREVIQPRGRIYLFFDEIQYINGWEKIINSYAQNPAEEMEIFITGSNSTMLSGELATLLSGRYISFTIFPFSFSEFTSFHGTQLNRESMINYLKTGGLPELLHITDEEMRRNYILSLRDTILLRDIVHRYRIKDSWLLENLFQYIVSETGRLFSVNNIVNYFQSLKIKANHETISNYLHYLKQSFLIHEVPRYHIKAKEILSGARKYYLNDVSYRNYTARKMETGLSQNLENMIYLHYLSKGYHVFTGNLAEKEIDFVAESGNKREYIQVTYLITDEHVKEREFGNLLLIQDHYPKKVISLDDFSIGNINGIEHLLAWDI